MWKEQFLFIFLFILKNVNHRQEFSQSAVFGNYNEYASIMYNE